MNESLYPKHASVPVGMLRVAKPTFIHPGPLCMCGIRGMHTGSDHETAMIDKDRRMRAIAESF